jgi:hypothetical protein
VAPATALAAAAAAAAPAELTPDQRLLLLLLQSPCRRHCSFEGRKLCGKQQQLCSVVQCAAWPLLLLSFEPCRVLLCLDDVEQWHWCLLLRQLNMPVLLLMLLLLQLVPAQLLPLLLLLLPLLSAQCQEADQTGNCLLARQNAAHPQ